MLAKSPTGIGQFANRYWRNHQPLNQGTSWQFDQYRLAIWPIPVGVLVNTGWWIGQYRLANWSIPVGELANTGWRFRRGGNKNMHYLYVCIVKSVNTGWRIGQYRLTISSIPVGELANTGWRIGQYRLAISPIPAKVHFRRFGQVRGRNRRF